MGLASEAVAVADECFEERLRRVEDEILAGAVHAYGRAKALLAGR